ncbi:MAG: SDR family NAD(P)-dependent oxidoreductase [Actinomycetes bacterium]
MRTTLRGWRALVTGASSGIGTALAERLAAAGVDLRLTGRSREALAEVASRTGGQVLAVDLAAPDAAVAVAEWSGPVDLLVCNAGQGWAGRTTDMPAGEARRLLDVNVAGHLELVRLLLPPMLDRRRGRVVLVSSIAGLLGVAEESVYAGTKASLHVFGESLRYELEGSGVGVTTVFPGAVDTPFFDRRGSPYARRFPRPVSVDDVAQAVVRGIERGRDDVFVPSWLVVPARLHGAAPGLVRVLQGRFGRPPPPGGRRSEP